MASRHRRAVRAALSAEHDIYRIERATVLRIRRDLEAAHAATMQRLASASASWDVTQARAVLAEIERQMLVWEQVSVSGIGRALPEVQIGGQQQVVAALSAGGIEVGVLPAIGTSFVAVSQQTLPVLITGVSKDVIRQVGAILRNAVLAQETPYVAMQKIGAVTGKGPFASAFARGEAIVRTEVGRIAQNANWGTLDALQRRDGGYLKEWINAGDFRVRTSHAFAHGQKRRVDEHFIVGGSRLMYPHDPAGPASETVNCRCISVPLHESWAPSGTSWT